MKVNRHHGINKNISSVEIVWWYITTWCGC